MIVDISFQMLFYWKDRVYDFSLFHNTHKKLLLTVLFHLFIDRLLEDEWPTSVFFLLRRYVLPADWRHTFYQLHDLRSALIWCIPSAETYVPYQLQQNLLLLGTQERAYRSFLLIFLLSQAF